MLNAVPATINAAARAVTLRHPNAQNATIYAKQVKRTAPESVGGLPVLGGLGVLDSEDEADYEYIERGDARVLFAGVYVGQPGNVLDADDGVTYAEGVVEATIECVLDPANPLHFVPDKNDVVMVEVSATIIMPYEIVGNTSTTSIPPYTRKYLLQPRADIDFGL